MSASEFFRAAFFFVWMIVGVLVLSHWFLSTATPFYITIDGVEHSYMLGPKEMRR